MTVVDKDVPSDRKVKGQFLTPLPVAASLIDLLEIKADLVVEPSCGEGVFLPLLEKFGVPVVALELDPVLAAKCSCTVGDFYEWKAPRGRVAFVGNPPYRSPALSLKKHGDYVNFLRKKYGVEGVREEAVLFILHAVHICDECEAHFILPKAIFQNNSPVFTKFKNFLNRQFGVRRVVSLSRSFESVSRDLVFVSMSSGPAGKTINVDGEEVPTEVWLGAGAGVIPFQRIFKKTHLGSVPCESLFLSCRGETRQEFRDRLVKLFSSEATEENLVGLLSHKGEPHLRALKDGNKHKIKVVLGYVEEAKKLVSDFSNVEDYKPIRHRHEDRWYFRKDELKRASFVYQLNSSPGPSFSFPGNPSNSSKDYFVYCDYDINRNSGPGAQRCVRLDDLEKNLTDEFQEWWKATGLDLNRIPDYLKWVGESDWYKEIKRKNGRFYFGVPEEFDCSFKR